jgi:post-segregation antitoxin (ccd killing protein)
MGRKLMEKNKMKKKMSISVDPDIIIKLKENYINISSLINKLLKDYIKNGNKNL